MEEYKLYRGYILGPGFTAGEVDIYRNKESAVSHEEFHSEDNEWEARSWIDREERQGSAQQADVDELNRQYAPKTGDVFKEGTLLIVVDRNGVQLFSLPLGGLSDRSQAWEEVYKTIMEGLPEEAYKPIE